MNFLSKSKLSLVFMILSGVLSLLATSGDGNYQSAILMALFAIYWRD